MLGGVADDGDHDHTNENFGDADGVRTLSMVPTRNSESNATNAVAMTRRRIALPRDQCSPFSPILRAPEKILWVRSEKPEKTEVGQEKHHGDGQ